LADVRVLDELAGSEAAALFAETDALAADLMVTGGS
jgi:hypothetical protein